MVDCSSLRGKTGTHLPLRFHLAHEYCFTLHDAMVELLRAGEAAAIFRRDIVFKDDEDCQLLEMLGDTFVWLAQTRRHEDLTALLATLVFPAVLADMLHCLRSSAGDAQRQACRRLYVAAQAAERRLLCSGGYRR
jgi:hypothetical protein